MILKEFVNWKLTHSDKVASAEGYPLVMENCKTNKKMKQLEIFGASDGVGEPTENLFRDDEIPATHTTKGLTIDYEGNGIFHLYGTFNGISGSTDRFVVNVPFDRNQIYSAYCKLLSGKIPGRIVPYFGISSETSPRTNWMSISATEDMQVGDIINNVRDGANTTNILPDATHISHFWWYFDSKTTPNVEFDVRMQVWLMEGNELKVFEPYGKYKIPVVVRGENFIPYSVVLANNYSEYRVLGTSYTIRGNVGKSAFSYDAGQLMFPSTSTISTNGIDVTKGKTYTLSFDYLLMEQGVYSHRIGFFIYGTSTAIRYQNQYIHGTIGETVSCNFSFTSEYDEKIAICFRINNNYVTLSNIRMEDADIEPVTQNVFINEPLGLDRYIDFNNKKVYSLDGSEEVIECSLPKLTNKTSVIEIDTTIAPSNIKGKYIKK